jgi:hypothetical protein
MTALGAACETTLCSWDEEKMLVRRSAVKQTSFMISFARHLLVACCIIAGTRFTAAAESKPVFLYSRNFNAKGEQRYLPDGNYKDLLQRLSRDFEVRVHDKPLTREMLAGVNVVLIANPSEKAVGNNPPPHHVDAQDIKTLTQFVRAGGALIVMGNQENHNLEVYDMNQLLKNFGLEFTNLYTDAKLLPVPETTPIIGGLKWGYYTGNLIRIDPRNEARPRALVNNDLSIKPPKGSRNQKGPLMAVAEPDKGRVLLVTDSGWLADWAFDEKGVGDVALKGQDNWEIFHRLALWCAHH